MLRRRILLILVAAPLATILVLATAFVWAAHRSSVFGAIDCGGGSAFSLSQLSPEHAVFTARVIRVPHHGRVDGHWGGDWAIGVVEESFWGLPAWFPHVVLLVNDNYWEDTTVLVNGMRADGTLTRFLPIVNTRYGCGLFSLRMPYAQNFLRLLRKPSASASNRITGYVRSPKVVGGGARSSAESSTIIPPQYSNAYWSAADYARLFRGEDTSAALPEAIVRVTGSSGSWDFMTDQDGVYLTSDLPAGPYTVQVLNPPPNQVGYFEHLRIYDAGRSVVWTQDLYTQWAGSIEGSVREVSGKPGLAFLELQNADGAPVSSGMLSQTQTSDDGQFRFRGLPIGGRYLVRLNPYGPQERWPYASLYYPSATLREEAKVLEIKESQPHLQNLDFKVKPSVERALPIKVEWPDGRPVADGVFCIIYRHGREQTYAQCGGDRIGRDC